MIPNEVGNHRRPSLTIDQAHDEPTDHPLDEPTRVSGRTSLHSAKQVIIEGGSEDRDTEAPKKAQPRRGYSWEGDIIAAM